MPKTTITNYDSIHKKLKRIFGPAKELLCVDCDGPARHWTLIHEAAPENIRYQEKGREAGRVFSISTEDYRPRCSQCHSDYDRKHGLERAPSGVKSTVKLHCTVPDCDRKHQAKGLCELHYRRQLRESKRNGF